MLRRQYLVGDRSCFRPFEVSGDQPSTIADFWNVDKFPGRRGLRKVPRVNLEWALMADGVAGEGL